MTDRINQLREKRAFYNRLGKRKRVDQIDAILVPLVTESLAQANLAEQVQQDLEWIARRQHA